MLGVMSLIAMVFGVLQTEDVGVRSQIAGRLLIDGARNYVVIRLDHVTTYPPQKAAREIVCLTPDKCV